MDSVYVYLIRNGIIIDSVQADINGFYSFYQAPNSTYTISASTHKPWMGVNAVDALKVKRHFGGSEFFTTSLKLHAADVNLSYNINTTDAVKITRRFVGSDTAFTGGDWVFEKPLGGDTLNVSPGLNDTVIVNNADVSQDFKALCVGDVNGSNFPPQGAKSPPKIELDYYDFVKLNADEPFELPIIAKTDQSVGSISLILNFPKELVQIFNVQCSMCNDQFSMYNVQGTMCNDQFSMNDEGNNLVYNVKGNELRIGWFENQSPLNFSTNDTILVIRGKTTGNFKAGDEIMLKIANNPLTELSDEAGTPFENVWLETLIIKHSDSHEVSNIENNPENDLEIYPNPSNGYVAIRYRANKAENIRIIIYDILGQKIKTVEDKYIFEGFNDFTMDLSSVPASIYSCKFVVDESYSLVRTILISK